MATSPFAERGGGTPRLFNFDLPFVKKTDQPLPEQTNVSTIQSILDIASGSGEWAIATAQAYPHMQVVGIDNDVPMVESARAQARARGVDNVHFTIMDPFQKLEMPDSSFELVNARFINGFIPAEAWSKVLSEFLRVTRAGGCIRLTEGELPISSNPAFAQIGGMISQALFMTGRSFSQRDGSSVSHQRCSGYYRMRVARIPGKWCLSPISPLGWRRTQISPTIFLEHIGSCSFFCSTPG